MKKEAKGNRKKASKGKKKRQPKMENKKDEEEPAANPFEGRVAFIINEEKEPATESTDNTIFTLTKNRSLGQSFVSTESFSSPKTSYPLELDFIK